MVNIPIWFCTTNCDVTNHIIKTQNEMWNVASAKDKPQRCLYNETIQYQEYVIRGIEMSLIIIAANKLNEEQTQHINCC